MIKKLSFLKVPFCSFTDFSFVINNFSCLDLHFNPIQISPSDGHCIIYEKINTSTVDVSVSVKVIERLMTLVSAQVNLYISGTTAINVNIC